MRPICINASRWDCTLEPIGEDRFAVRLGMRMVRGLNEQDAARIIAARADEPFASIEELWRRADVGMGAFNRLAEADAFRVAMRLEIGRASCRERVCQYV